ncbi:ribonuclease HII [Tissierella sp. Yu-01]|uniref:ribonuclease HII n=1 Tax=Tissierella sp. Yu-01 TaxID=3035694 RepID=UPI00240DABAD|nr:ribonuclease HII [Tissierella sp. Yu-01]WFA09779.1 ribonuclease HII [Tissierella sp. Yu-01]
MITLEMELHANGYSYVACIDEVGRGCLLGDVVACAIIMPKGLHIEGVKDSKKLTPKKRDKLYDIILDNCIAFGIGRIDSSKIDEINIKESTREAMKLAIENLVDKFGNRIVPDYLLIDAEKINLSIPQEGIVKGDDKCHGIACASIVAKVFRDRLCLEWAKIYPEYGIDRHKGYGTKLHVEAIKKYGVTPIHRNTFLKKILDGKLK